MAHRKAANFNAQSIRLFHEPDRFQFVLLAGAEPIGQKEMSTDTTDELRSVLEQKKRDDLHIIARRLKIQGYRRRNKPDLISAILDTGDKSKLARSLSVSWWDKYHNHVYGAATVLGVILSVVFFVVPNLPSDRDNQRAANDTSDLPGDSPSAEASRDNVSDITFQEYIDEHKRREDLTSLQKEQFFKHYVGIQVNWIGYVRGVEERGDDVVIAIEPKRESGIFDVARCELPAAWSWAVRFLNTLNGTETLRTRTTAGTITNLRGSRRTFGRMMLGTVAMGSQNSSRDAWRQTQPQITSPLRDDDAEGAARVPHGLDRQRWRSRLGANVLPTAGANSQSSGKPRLSSSAASVRRGHGKSYETRKRAVLIFRHGFSSSLELHSLG